MCFYWIYIGGRGGEREGKRIRMRYVYVPIPHDECIYYVLQQEYGVSNSEGLSQ